MQEVVDELLNNALANDFDWTNSPVDEVAQDLVQYSSEVESVDPIILFPFITNWQARRKGETPESVLLPLSDVIKMFRPYVRHDHMMWRVDYVSQDGHIGLVDEITHHYKRFPGNTLVELLHGKPISEDWRSFVVDFLFNEFFTHDYVNWQYLPYDDGLFIGPFFLQLARQCVERKTIAKTDLLDGWMISKTRIATSPGEPDDERTEEIGAVATLGEVLVFLSQEYAKEFINNALQTDYQEFSDLTPERWLPNHPS
jgi:hypothetical protein